MEESEKRRERLKAMRMEASQPDVSNGVEPCASPGCFTNPLMEQTSASRPGQESFATPRFDFYTDPISAFSGNKRSSSSVSNQNSQDHFTPPRNIYSPMGPRLSSPHSAGPRNPTVNLSPAHQYQPNYSPDQRMFRAHGPHNTQRSPIGTAIPFPTHLTPPPGVWNGSGETGSFRFPSNPPRGYNFPPSPGFRPTGSPSFGSGQGRGSWFSPGSGRGGRSPSPYSGRGMSPGSGQHGGRGRGSHGHGHGHGHASAEDRPTAKDRPDMFYRKTMVEDPWKNLEPVILKVENWSKSWISKSVKAKKSRVSEEYKGPSSSQPNLAEYLAASFNETVSEVPE